MARIVIECSTWTKEEFLSFVKWEKDNNPKFKKKRVTYEDALVLLMQVTGAEIEGGMRYPEEPLDETRKRT